MKLLFAPIGIVAGLLAGVLARRGFDRLWRRLDSRDPPTPERSDATYPKLVAALLIEGAVFQATKGVVDHAARRGFAKATGRWPGEIPDDGE